MPYPRYERFQILKQAWPIIIANASVPMLGLVDTAVIGRNGDASALGALALSNLIFNVIYWAFGFFRMSTTGFVAQARGENDIDEAQAVFIRSQILAVMCGFGLILLQSLIAYSAFTLLRASTTVEGVAQQYFAIRIWGAPATLALYGIMGVCIGFGRTKLLLCIQVGLNVANVFLDILFASWLNLGVQGIALGTLIAEWSALIVGSLVVYRFIFNDQKGGLSLTGVRSYFSRNKMTKLVRVNGDMFVRTLFLLGGFAWFTNAGAQFGDTVLAANHILLMLISFSAFFLDGFAFVVEEKLGGALGAKDWQRASKSIYITSELALLTAVVLAVATFCFGQIGLGLLVDSNAVQLQTQQLLHWAALYILVSVAAFQLDGIFIGATLSAAMRTTTILSFIVLIIFYYLIGINYGVQGLWLSFIAFVMARAMGLICYWPQVRRRFKR